MCILLIDEIETLAPNRMDKDNKKDGSLLGVFLAIMDGSKSTPNLKIFASTNLKENMDEAFLRRMEIQLFVGNPSPESRYLWIKKKASQCENQPHYDDI